jgi:predicted RNA-binding Zn ribbon-like protein
MNSKSKCRRKCNDPGCTYIFHEVKMQVENAMTLAAHSIFFKVKINASGKCNDPGCT